MKPNRVAVQLNKTVDIAKTLPRAVSSRAANLLSIERRSNIYYFIPGSNWATDWVGRYIVDSLHHRGIPIYSTTFPQILKNEIIHFHSLGAFVTQHHRAWVTQNKQIATVFHGFSQDDPHDPNAQSDHLIRQVETLIKEHHKLEKIVTASTMMKKRMIRWGIPAEKIVFIPLGIDLEKFHPVSQERKIELRQTLGIPRDAFVIGSFQKDGAGWEDGLIPKHIKGPDCFVKTMQKLKTDIPNLFVLLTGPARGYVKEGLREAGIIFQHRILADFAHIPACYQVLDCYLVASREEGGPKAVLESQATGIPLVTTRVGLVGDVVTHMQDGLIADVEDIDQLTAHILNLYQDDLLRNNLKKNGAENVQRYAWDRIAQAYNQHVYTPLLS